MMAKQAILWSASSGGFYLDGISTVVPDDVVPVTAARHKKLMDAQTQGARIVPGTNGRPAIDWPAAPDVRAMIARRIKQEAARRIKQISPDWRQMNDLRDPSPAGAARFAAIDAVRTASALIETDLAQTATTALDDFPVGDHPLWPTVQQEG